jgi:hypothetical protein
VTCPIPVTVPGHGRIPDPELELAVKPMRRWMAEAYPALPADSDPAIIGSRANQERQKP